MERCSSRHPASSSLRIGSAPSRAIISVTCRALTTAGIYQERELLSVTANTREDLHALLAEAVEARVQPRTTAYALTDANRGPHDMKHSNIEGTPVLAIT